MEVDDLLCSRNSRSPKTFVEHAQWETIQPAHKGEDSQGKIPTLYSLFNVRVSKLQHHVVTDPDRSRIAAGAFVAEKDMCGVELGHWRFAPASLGDL